jgi:cystathionine beta-synthase
VTEHDLLSRLVSTPESFDALVADVMTPPLPMVGTGEAIEVASARLAETSAVLVVDGGHPTGIITRSDLLDFLSGQGR